MERLLTRLLGALALTAALLGPVRPSFGPVKPLQVKRELGATGVKRRLELRLGGRKFLAVPLLTQHPKLDPRLRPAEGAFNILDPNTGEYINVDFE